MNLIHKQFQTFPWPALLIALMSDGLDVLPPLWLPIIGDVADAVAILINFFLIGPYALIGATEFLPLVVTDIFPSHTLAVLFAWWRSS